MKLTLIAFLLIPVFAFSQIDTIISSNIKRTYKLQLPKSYNKEKSFPLIFVLHGYFYENLGMPEYSSFDKFVDKDCIVAYPHGLKEENGINYFWNSGGNLSKNYGGIDDVKFIDNLIDTLSHKYAVNTDSVFIVGHSNGGMMAYRLAMELSTKITAMANLAGSMMLDTITPECPVPILHIHGTDDPAVPSKGSSIPGWEFLATEDVLKTWVKWNHCEPNPDTIANTNSHLSVQWADKNHGNKVVVSYIKKQGHDWAEITNSGWNIAENIWSFFTKGRLYDED